MFDWIQLRFQSGVLLQTAYANDFLRQKLRSTGQGRLHMAFETQVQTLMSQLAGHVQAGDAELYRAALNRTLRELARLCVFRYCNCLLSTLSTPVKRLGNMPRLPYINDPDEVSPQERIGLEGLSYDLIDRATGRDPWVSPIRDGGGQATGTGGFSAWPNTWEIRIQLLFDWDDGFPRTWDNRPWRVWTRYCYDALKTIPGNSPYTGRPVSPRIAEKWRTNFALYATRYLRVLPLYESGKLYQTCQLPAFTQPPAPARPRPSSDNDSPPPRTRRPVVYETSIRWIAAFPSNLEQAHEEGKTPKWEALRTWRKDPNRDEPRYDGWHIARQYRAHPEYFSGANLDLGSPVNEAARAMARGTEGSEGGSSDEADE
ncbi:unnamed protein product [Zymoseptoria tritici ST99CH_1A5]|uniref:Uncharacterized protein n=1 Tax=Zymoseptoria tritici ST99CH_1A5 TaxID=1276529 RepID=A0A1Y6M1R6_ZYMTR|nr:unnamed protein product [Zymoseptoria tritici ST99CH_1A5]